MSILLVCQNYDDPLVKVEMTRIEIARLNMIYEQRDMSGVSATLARALFNFDKLEVELAFMVYELTEYILGEFYSSPMAHTIRNCLYVDYFPEDTITILISAIHAVLPEAELESLLGRLLNE